MEFKHLGVAVQSMEQAISFHKELFGYKVLSGPFDDPIQRVSVCFLGKENENGFCVELVTPYGEGSPINLTLEKGVSAYHVCYEVDDIDAAVADARSKGCMVLGKPVPAVAFEGRRIAWLYTPTKQLLELVER